MRVAPMQHPTALARRAVGLQMGLKTPQTVGDAKEAFQEAYGRPVTNVLQGFVQEMITSTQFALVAPSYEYSRVFSVGFDKLCGIFLQASPSEADREAIRSSMCIGLGMDPKMVKKDAEALLAAAQGMTEEQLFEAADLKKIIAKEGSFKYTYTFGAGLICLMEAVGTEPGPEAIDSWCERLGMKSNAFKRDYQYYLDSVKKMDGVKEMMLQMQVAAKRAEATRLAEKAAKAAKEAEEAEAAEAV